MFFNDLSTSDLACENQRSDRKGKMANTFVEMGIQIHKTTFDPNCRNGLLPRDAYYGIECGPLWSFDEERAICTVQILAKKLRKMISAIADKRDTYCVLVAGLGNRWLAADSLGPLCSDKVTPNISNEISGVRICTIAPGVSGQTGIDTAVIVRSAASAAKAELVIAVDALRASAPERLGAFIQISNCGISPGSGINASKTALQLSTVGVPVLSIGIPTVISASAFISEGKIASKYADMIVTNKECDIIASTGASIIARAIEQAFYSVW